MNPKISQIAVASDFDGTLIENDLPFLILKKYGRKGWEHYDELLAKGEITLEECISKQYAMIQAKGKSQLLEYAANLWQFRGGSLELMSYCKEHKLDFVVVSAGLEFCIRATFKANDVSVPTLLVPRAKFLGKGKGFEMNFPRFGSFSNFKESFIVSKKEQGKFVVFIGDGTGDYPAATRADKVFALKNSALESLCKKNAIEHTTITDLVSVLEFLKSSNIGSLPARDLLRRSV